MKAFDLLMGFLQTQLKPHCLSLFLYSIFGLISWFPNCSQHVTFTCQFYTVPTLILNLSISFSLLQMMFSEIS